MECGNYYHERREYFGERESSLTSLLGVPDMFAKVLDFFRAIELYNKI